MFPPLMFNQQNRSDQKLI